MRQCDSTEASVWRIDLALAPVSPPAVYMMHPLRVRPKCLHRSKHTWLFQLQTSRMHMHENVILNQARQRFKCSFIPHCLSLLCLISSVTLPPPSSLPLSPSSSPYIKRWVALSPSHRYLLRRVTSRRISIFIISYTDFKVSACLSERWESATRKPAQIAKQ